MRAILIALAIMITSTTAQAQSICELATSATNAYFDALDGINLYSKTFNYEHERIGLVGPAGYIYFDNSCSDTVENCNADSRRSAIDALSNDAVCYDAYVGLIRSRPELNGLSTLDVFSNYENAVRDALRALLR